MKRKRSKLVRAKAQEEINLSEDDRCRIDMLFNEPIEENHLAMAISHLKHKVNEIKYKKPKVEHCVFNKQYCIQEPSSKIRLGAPILRGRQGLYISEQLRKAILQHDWDSAVKLILLLMEGGGTQFTVLLTKACLVTLFNHPMATPEMLINYIRNTTGYMLDSDIEDFIILMFALRKRILPGSKQCHKWRRTNWNKVVSDPSYTLYKLDDNPDDPSEER